MCISHVCLWLHVCCLWRNNKVTMIGLREGDEPTPANAKFTCVECVNIIMSTHSTLVNLHRRCYSYWHVYHLVCHAAFTDVLLNTLFRRPQSLWPSLTNGLTRPVLYANFEKRTITLPNTAAVKADRRDRAITNKYLDETIVLDFSNCCCEWECDINVTESSVRRNAPKSSTMSRRHVEPASVTFHCQLPHPPHHANSILRSCFITPPPSTALRCRSF